MKILCIANIRLPTERGYGVAVMKQCEAFATLGHDVVLAYANRRNHITSELFAYYRMQVKLFRAYALPHIDLLHFGRVGHFITTVSFFPSALWCALRERPDIIYTRDDFTGAFLSLFFRNVVWEVHNARRTRHLCLLRRRAHAVVYISQGLRAFYTSRCATTRAREVVAPSGIALEQFDAVVDSKDDLRKELSIPRGARVIGFVGKMTTAGEGKGVDTLISAFASLFEDTIDVFLLLVGADEKEVLDITKDMQARGIPQTAFMVVPHVSQDLVPRYMKACDVLVMNYPDTTEHYRLYMSPLKLFEYMASGVPIITTDLPSVREVVDETMVRFVRTNDSQDLAHTIFELLEKREIAGILTKNAKRKVREFYSWESRVNKLIVLFQFK